MINNQGKALLLLLAVACSSSHAQTPPGYQGVVELEETALAFETGGRVRRLAVTEGDRVEAGAVIAELDDELARATRAARVLDVEAARSQMELVAAPARPSGAVQVSGGHPYGFWNAAAKGAASRRPRNDAATSLV